MSWCHAIFGNVSQKSSGVGNTRCGVAPAAVAAASAYWRSSHAGSSQHEVNVKNRSPRDRKSTRLNSSHGYISYAVFFLKKQKKQERSSLVGTDTERVSGYYTLAREY